MAPNVISATKMSASPDMSLGGSDHPQEGTYGT